MRKSNKTALVAGFLVLAGGLSLEFDPGAGRVPLGTILILFGFIGAYRAVRLRAAAN